MILYSWHPYAGPFGRLRDDLNRLFDERVFGRGPLSAWLTGRQFPRVNVSETEDALVVECEVPGLSKDDLDISIESGILTVRGEIKRDEDRKPESYHRRERGAGPFERSIELPAKVDVEKVSAKLTDGILTIELPKHPESKPKTIEVKVK
jgi:HSP20 family protein